MSSSSSSLRDHRTAPSSSSSHGRERAKKTKGKKTWTEIGEAEAAKEKHSPIPRISSTKMVEFLFSSREGRSAAISGRDYFFLFPACRFNRCWLDLLVPKVPSPLSGCPSVGGVAASVGRNFWRLRLRPRLLPDSRIPENKGAK